MGKQELVIKILSFVLLALHSDVGGAKPASILFFLRRLAWASLGSALLLPPHESAPGCPPLLAHRRAPSRSPETPPCMFVELTPSLIWAARTPEPQTQAGQAPWGQAGPPVPFCVCLDCLLYLELHVRGRAPPFFPCSFLQGCQRDLLWPGGLEGGP